MNENLPTRNSNPGDLRDPSTGNFQQFSNPSQGYSALLNDVQSKMDGNTSTGLNGKSNLVDFSKVYAPDSDGNNSGKYAADLANQLGVSPDTSIGSLEPRIGDFSKAIATNEGYDEHSQTDVSKDPKTQGIAGSNNSMPSWEKWALGAGGAALGALGIGALTVGTDGLDLPFLAGAGEAAAGATEATGAAEAGATAGEVASESPGLISKGVSLAKKAAMAEGVSATVSGVKGIFGGNQSTGGSQTPPPTDYNNPSTPLAGNTIPQSVGASQEIYRGLNAALSQSQTGRVFSQSPAGQAGLQGLSEYGIVPEVINGNYDTTGAMKQNQNMVGIFSDNVGKVLDAEGQHANLDEATSAAIENMKKYTPSNEWEEAQKHIESQAGTYKQFADPKGNISLGTMERMKKEQYASAGNWDSTTTSAKRAAHKALGVGAKATILKNTKNKELYEHAMKEESKLINGQKVLKKLNGKKAHKPDSLAKDILHHLGEYASIAVGDKMGGPFGAIVGAMLGNRIEKLIGKKFGENVLETKSMKKALEIVGNKSPEVAGLLQQTIKKYRLAEEHKKVMDTKREEYKNKKEAILNPKKESEYEPYKKELPVIKGGGKLESKEQGLYSKLPTIKA